MPARPEQPILVDGSYVTRRKLAEELGISIEVLKRRLRRERSQPGALSRKALSA